MWTNMKRGSPSTAATLRMDAARPRHRRRAELRRSAPSTSAAGPEMLYDVKSRVQLPADARDLLHERELGAHRRRRFHRDVSSLQGRARSDRHLHERVRRGVRLPVSAAARRRCAGRRRLSRSPMPARSSSAATRRFAYSIKPLGTPGGATARFDASYTDVDLAAVDGLLRSARAALRRTRLGREPARVAERAFPRDIRRAAT